jgi:hypothetical protein
MGISAFACGKVDMLIQFFPAVLAFLPVNLLVYNKFLENMNNPFFASTGKTGTIIAFFPWIAATQPYI